MTHKIKLATVCQQIRGVSYTPKDMAEIPTEGYIPILRANNIQEKLVFNELVYVNANKISKIQLLKGGDIVVCASSGSKNLVGKAARFVSSPVDQVSFGAFCKVVRPRNIDASYLSHFFNSSYYRNTISKIAQGASINNIRNEHLDNLDINVPTPSEQKRLAERLDKVQELIAKQKEQIAKLDLLIKSRFLDMFGDPISNPKKWRKEKIFDVIETNISKVKSKYTEDDTIKYVDISSIDNITNTVRRFTTYLVKNAPSRAQQCLLKDDILISTVRPNLRNIAINNRTDCNMVASSGFCVLRSNVCNPMWLFEIIKSNEFTSYLSNLTTGANYPAVKDHDVYNYLFPCPPVILQNQFANFVKSVEQQKEVFSTRLSHLEILYKSLMQEYFG